MSELEKIQREIEKNLEIQEKLKKNYEIAKKKEAELKLINNDEKIKNYMSTNFALNTNERIVGIGCVMSNSTFDSTSFWETLTNLYGEITSKKYSTLELVKFVGSKFTNKDIKNNEVIAVVDSNCELILSTIHDICKFLGISLVLIVCDIAQNNNFVSMCNITFNNSLKKDPEKHIVMICYDVLINNKKCKKFNKLYSEDNVLKMIDKGFAIEEKKKNAFLNRDFEKKEGGFKKKKFSKFDKFNPGEGKKKFFNNKKKFDQL
jgi:hypothetical protein